MMALTEAIGNLRQNLRLTTTGSNFSVDTTVRETLRSVKILTDLFLQQEIRDDLREEDCDVILRTVEATCQRQNENDTFLELNTELFRCLRNVCANNKNIQNWFIKQPIYPNIIIPYITKLITALSVEHYNPTTVIKIIECLRCGLQFIGNLIVGNELHKKIVWENFFCYFCWLLDQNIDERIMRYNCMILYNCIVEMPNHRRQLLENTDNKLFSVLLNITMIKEVEWGLIIIELMLEEDGFLSIAFNHISDEQRFYLLDIILDCLQRHRIESGKHAQCLSNNNLDFLKEVFIQKVDLVLKMCHNFSCTSNDLVLVMKLLEILCCASAKERYQKLLQNDDNLIIIATFFLKGIHLAGKDGNKYFAAVEKLSEAINLDNDSLKNNPVHGLKRDLVRLIGNLCWECKDNQDKVREMDGIAVLLDCCRIDAQNPFIIQWVIFAIRNLCENNPENQAVIANMENLGFNDSSMNKIKEAILDSDKRESQIEENYNFCCEEFNRGFSLKEERKPNDDKYSDVMDLFF